MNLRRRTLAVSFLCVFLGVAALDPAPAAGKAAPAPTPRRGTEYLTLNPGEVVDLSPGPVRFDTRPVLLRHVGRAWKYRATGSGHTRVTVGAGARERTVMVFVAPTPSLQIGRGDLEWYRTQFGSGASDCGPALVSMSILWARGNDVPVKDIRAEIGWPSANGGTSLEDLQAALNRHRIAWKATPVRGVPDLVAVLKRGHLALMLIRSGGIARVKGDPRKNLFGRYYDYEDGHYVLAKGYSLDRNYFVVYDPYPADWDDNDLRYDDGKTMIGKNRYYPARQVLTALKADTVLEVLRDR